MSYGDEDGPACVGEGSAVVVNDTTNDILIFAITRVMAGVVSDPGAAVFGHIAKGCFIGGDSRPYGGGAAGCVWDQALWFLSV